MDTSILIYIWMTIIFLIILYVLKIKDKNWNNNLFLNNYYKKKYFFTPSENKFYRQLYKVVTHTSVNKFVIFSKVRVSDIIWTDKKYRESWKKINPRHFDFVICDISKDFEPILILEFDWYTHQNNNDVKQRDSIKNKICEHIKLPLLRITKDYSEDELQKLLSTYLFI